jgi:hypothetical protein
LVKITLWGNLAHFVTDELIRKPTTIVVTYVLVMSPQYKGEFTIYA